MGAPPPRPGIADFTFGNPQELPLPGLVDALQRHAVPQDKDWFAYKMSEEEPRTVVAESLRRRTGIAYRAEDVAMTAGAFGALGVTIRAVCDVGDEVIYLSPPWFFYELMIASAGATAVRVDLAEPSFDLDIDAIAEAITPRTRAIIVNTPHNPTGRIYREPELHALGEVLRRRPRATAGRSSSCRTSPTTGSCSTASTSAARRSTTTRPR